MNKYSMGQSVWYARVRGEDEQIPCPDCFGQRFLRVIMGDGSEVSVECTGCKSGYDIPKGTITKHISNAVEVRSLRITGMETGYEDGIEIVKYHLGITGCSYYSVAETECFDSSEEAEKRAIEIKAELMASEEKRLLQREKPKRSWAWNATYHARGG
jgi:hypothetical protein